MKKITFTLCVAAMLLAKAAQAQITDPAPYCAGGLDDDNGNFYLPHAIERVRLGSLDNSSGSSSSPGKHYLYYNNLPAPELALGYTYDLFVDFDYPSTVHYITTYIDFNHDEDFDDAGEKVLEQSVHANNRVNPANTTVIIPATATPGITRMRVMVFEDEKYLANGGTTGFPCTNDTLDWGETEDYDVNIVIGPTSVKEAAVAKAISIYPNPASSLVTIGIDISNAQVSVMDVRGAVMNTVVRKGNQLDVSSLPTGLYFLKIIKDKQAYTQRLHVER